MRTPEQDRKATKLLRQYDSIVQQLFALGVNPYLRCVCPWDQDHSQTCPRYWTDPCLYELVKRPTDTDTA